MICNKVLIALSALIAVAASMPWFLDPNTGGVLGGEEPGENPYEYRRKPAEQNTASTEIANQGAQAQDTQGGDSGDAAAGGQAFGGADAFANRAATFNAVAAAGAGGNSNDGDNSPNAGGAVVAAGAGGNSGNVAHEGVGVQQGAAGAGVQHAAVNNAPFAAPFAPVVDAAAAGGQSAQQVNAIGGPSPGELKAESNGGKGAGLGIAAGVSLLVVATAAIAVVAVRYHRRYRF